MTRIHKRNYENELQKETWIRSNKVWNTHGFDSAVSHKLFKTGFKLELKNTLFLWACNWEEKSGWSKNIRNNDRTSASVQIEPSVDISKYRHFQNIASSNAVSWLVRTEWFLNSSGLALCMPKNGTAMQHKNELESLRGTY